MLAERLVRISIRRSRPGRNLVTLTSHDMKDLFEYQARRSRVGRRTRPIATESRIRFNPDKQVMVTDYESRRSTKTVKKEK